MQDVTDARARVRLEPGAEVRIASDRLPWRSPIATTTGLRSLDAAHASDRAVWLRRWRAAGREPFAHPAFGELFAEPGDHVVALTTDAGVLMPLRLRAIPGAMGMLDATGPYGYGGAYRPAHAAGRQPELWSAVASWARRHQVVTAFSRMHPFDDEVVQPPSSCLVDRSVTVVRTVLADDEAVLADADRKVRKNVRRAIDDGIEVRVTSSLDDADAFARIYAATMERRGADARYRFESAFFDRLHRELAGSFVYATATQGGRVVSSELVLHSERHAYSFLGGTDERAFASRPNELLKLAVVRWCREQGIADYVLGGGATPGDGIERYKRAFAPTGARPFRTLELVLDPEEESRLSQGCATASFPAYRGETGAGVVTTGRRA
ncbi:GNAT family N-acetyltransferase [Agrococcus sp. SGAir0287]|uniref:GNAT family N-acetyltransferase n=1 Tax=Agrococcus sp. SGAir0287 TaxID=2070347 RepID=UPI0010CCC625|nr:GNAT family N-acetyltransferase [Agrococcus sp. SGAir0287]QCR19861.1 methicillin resistance protein [Agrococcus sp. SGAir0287]